MINPVTYNIVNDMDFVRSLCAGIHSARKTAGIPTIQPLMTATLYKEPDFDWFMVTPYRRLVEEECNLKRFDWDFLLESDYARFGLRTESRLNFKMAGRVLGGRTQEVAGLVRDGLYTVNSDESIEVGGVTLESGLVETKRTVDNDSNLRNNHYVVPAGGSSFVVLDTMIYSGLYMERLAQEIVKLVNAKRREDGMGVSDSVAVRVDVGSEYAAMSGDLVDKVQREAKCRLILDLNPARTDPPVVNSLTKI